jgi:hypothetical protein
MPIIPYDISDFEFVTDAIFLISIDVDESIEDDIFGVTTVIDEIEKFEEFTEFYIGLGEGKGVLHERYRIDIKSCKKVCILKIILYTRLVLPLRSLQHVSVH